MTRPESRTGLLLLILSVAVGSVGTQTHAQTGTPAAAPAARLSQGEQQIAASSKAGHFSFVLFYGTNDRLTQAAYQTLKAEVGKRKNMAILPIRLDNAAERGLIERFDATRAPMPAIVALAPNGAVTGVFSQQIKLEEVDGAFATPGYAQCIKAMQDNRIVLLCVQPATRAFVPQGVQQFQADRLYHERTHVVNISVNDPAEARFIQQLRLRSDVATPQVVFMAPPGVLLGTYDASVTHATLTEKLVAAGKCCDDKNCKHHRTATGATQSRVQ
jgi:hypothetical protein